MSERKPQTLIADLKGLLVAFAESTKACEVHLADSDQRMISAYWQGRFDSMKSARDLLQGIIGREVTHLGEHVHTQACYSDFGTLACGKE